MRLPVAIQLTSTGSGSLYLGAVDVSGIVASGRLTFKGGELGHLELDLIGFPVDATGPEVDVTVSAEHAALLVQLGWTPPQEAGS